MDLNGLPNLTPSPTVVSRNTAVPRGSRWTLMETLLLIFLIIIVFWFLLKPKYEQWLRLREKQAMLETQYGEVKAQIAKFYQLNEQLKKSEGELKRLDEVLPLDNRPTKVYFELERILALSGVSIGSIAVEMPPMAVAGVADSAKDPLTVERVVKQMNVNVFFTGTAAQMMNLMRSLENNVRVFDVINVDVGAEKGELLSVKMLVRTYYYSPK